MNMFDIYVSNDAKKKLKIADKALFERVFSRIKALALDPYPADAKRVIGGKEKVFGVRVVDYRILYVVY